MEIFGRQEGNVGTYMKGNAEHIERKWRNVQEGKGGTYRKDMEERTGRKRRNTQKGNQGTCMKEKEEHTGRKKRNMQERKIRGSWKDIERKGHALSVIPRL